MRLKLTRGLRLDFTRYGDLEFRADEASHRGRHTAENRKSQNQPVRPHCFDKFRNPCPQILCFYTEYQKKKTHTNSLFC
jgi:hypothetical protein